MTDVTTNSAVRYYEHLLHGYRRLCGGQQTSGEDEEESEKPKRTGNCMAEWTNENGKREACGDDGPAEKRKRYF
ncbi:unnamed protein product [Caenorhabditis sp. 36 PRJEB53466]|nr:unnamed protein product [Caenorhabditis sp. 36 PRJEB53466]